MTKKEKRLLLFCLVAILLIPVLILVSIWYVGSDIDLSGYLTPGDLILND
jgi:hypothetical protein